MNKPEFPPLRDIVLVGGGHSHVFVLRNFGMKPIKGARLTLISPQVDTPYSGMLPGLIAGHYTFDEAHIDLGPLARFARARFLNTQVTAIDPEARLIHCADGRPPVRYDILSLNTGSTPVMPAHVVFERKVLAVKPVDRFLEGWNAIQENVLAQPDRRIGIVGAGAGGVELALSIDFALGKLLAEKGGVGNGRPAVHLFTRDDQILVTHNPDVRSTFRETLAARGIAVHTDFDVDHVSQSAVHAGTRAVEVDDVIWVTGASPPSWIAEGGLDVNDQGFVMVDGNLNSTSHKDVFAAGDVASMVGAPRPKSGVFAVRQGPALIANLRASVLNRPLKRHKPQATFLSLVSTGDKYAVASWGRWTRKGAWVWRWKDKIDRDFMRKFNELPRMDAIADAVLPTVADVPTIVAESQKPEAMRCGGCGAKVGPVTLSNVLSEIAQKAPGHLHGAEGQELDDAAAIVVPEGKTLVQSVDSFPSMIDDPYVFGQITANHCLGDLYAMGAVPHSALAIAGVPFGLAEKTSDTLLQMLSGAINVLEEAGCVLRGGHTSETAQLTLGFTVNGVVEPDQLRAKSALEDEQTLILTKPIGTGVLFAAGQRGTAKGRWVAGAVRTALQSNRDGADILVRHGARAMTDVTGFGLAGHLREMLVAAGLGASLSVDSVPTIDGALAAARAGASSTMLEKNLALRASVEAPSRIANDAMFDLLFDPQTAGGLLAGVSPRTLMNA